MANQNDDRFDGVKKVATAALALGAGAAFLYRGGGDELLSKGFRRASMALNDTRNTMSKRTLSEINGEGRQFLKESVDTFKRSYANNSEVKETLRLDTPNSLFNAFQIEHTLRDEVGREKELRKMFQQKFQKDLKMQLQNQESLSNLSSRKINNIVDNAITHISETFEYADPNIGEFDVLPDAYEFSEKFRKENFGKLNKDEIKSVEDIILSKFKTKAEESARWISDNQSLTDNMADEISSFDNLAERFGTAGDTSVINDLLGDRQATLKDVVKNPDQFNKLNLISEATQNPIDVLERAKELIAKDERYGDLLIDKSLRIKDGQIRSYAEAANLEKKFENDFLHTLPGKILKPLETRVNRNNASNFIFSGSGSTDYLLPKLIEGRDSTILRDSYVRLNNRSFRINGTVLERIHEMDDVFPTSGQYGSSVRLYKNITGDVDYYDGPKGYIRSKLDLGSSPKAKAPNGIWSKANKYIDPEWAPNIINRTLNGDHVEDSANKFFENMKEVNRFFKKATKKLDKTTIARLSSNASDERTRDIFDLLKLDDNQLLSSLGDYSRPFMNKDLESLVKRYKHNPKDAKSMISISSDIADVPLIGKHTKAETFSDMIRKELSKEAFLNHKDKFGDDAVKELIDNTKLSFKQKSEAKYLANWADFQQTSGIYNSNVNPPTANQMEDAKANITSLFNSEKNEDFQKTVRQMVTDKTTILDESGAPQAFIDNIEKANRPNSYIYVRKSISALDILQNLNDKEKVKSFAKQFTAGRKNMEDFTSASFYPYFSLFRLIDAIPNLAFSPSNTGNVKDLAMNITLKRALPMIAAGTAFSYLNYESKNLTGRSLTEASANSLANFDLGIRTIQDTFGISEHLKDIYYTNPAATYYAQDEHRTADEQRDWYRNGKTAVRKGRWWGLLSNSEISGGKVEYFEHNFLKQASTPWRDIGTYGSSEEKWKHSVVPTLRHPLSPVRYLLDPYWLEEQNKYSRPYPVTAPMFGEGTPWSGILNATVGNVIKPQRKMHKQVLGNDYVDVRDLIAQRNNAIKATSTSQLTLTSSNSATEEVIRDTGEGSAYSYTSTVSGADLGNSGQLYAGASMFVPYLGESNKVNFADKLFLSTMNLGMAMPQLEDINARIKKQAQTRGMSQTTYAKSYDNMIAADTIDIMRDKDAVADLRNLSNNREYLTDISYSAKQLSGIYGFLIQETIPSKQRYALESAGQMSSFTRAFWDESVGSIGGGFMEIARRFFPHENRDITYLNPIRNNMPSWMPERFKHGDPYIQVKKGEMRLPGKAYEAINNYEPDISFNIHPYMIGADEKELTQYFINKNNADSYLNSLPQQSVDVTQKEIHDTNLNIIKAQKEVTKLLNAGRISRGEFYSDFEKFKILADVAPWSQEYKEIKTTVKATMTMDQQKEYFDTLKRVDKQSKQHDFYNYMYLGVKTNEKEGYIDTVTNKGITLVGSDKLYTMAGIETTQEALSTKLASGMKVKLKYEALDENEQTINSVVYTGSENVNRLLVKDKLATRKSGTSIDAQALATDMQEMTGKIWEAVGHAPIPFIHSKFLKIETARESYENEQVYGTPYATWSHPIKGYIKPAFNIAMNASPAHAAVGTAALAANIYFNTTGKEVGNSLIRKGAQIANILATPGAVSGAVIGYGINLSADLVQKGAMTGSAIWAGGYLLTNARNPILAAGAGATLGKVAGEFLEKGTGNKTAAMGAVIGIGISHFKNPDMNLKEAFSKWIPKETKKRWDMEEYFDRLEYIKYKGLYEKASRKALRKEGVDIKRILSEMKGEEDETNEKKEKILAYKQKLGNSPLKNSEYGKELMMKIDNELVGAIESKTVIAGEYTKSALAYKQAMDSTMYGLQEDASWAQILRALPKNDRDYFLEFAKVKDPQEQDKILKTMSPYKRRILQNLWGRKPDKIQSNASYFGNHKLPGMFWEGWKPNVDMDHIQMKTIENEGMMLSDFGFYDSNLQEPGADRVNPINYEEGSDMLSVQKNLFTALNGLGLIGVDVSIQPSQKPGLQMVADLTKITDYRIKDKINSIFGKSYY